MKLRSHSIPLRAISLAVLLAVDCGSPPPLGGESTGSEYDVKAAFLFHFAQFVEWPADAFHDADSPLKYCTIGEDPFRGALDETLKGKSVAHHPLQVQHLIGKGQISGCQILFIGAAEQKRLGEELTSANGHPVLSVGETEHFTTDGGMIGFLMENNKVRFDINLEAAEHAKLKISARLLLLAKDIIGNHE
jgi:YfiR/HmsC-like